MTGTLLNIGRILSFCMRVALANDRQLKNLAVTDQYLDSVLLVEFIRDFRRREGFRQTKQVARELQVMLVLANIE